MKQSVRISDADIVMSNPTLKQAYRYYDKKSSNWHPWKPCKNIETSPFHKETSFKDSLSFCQDDEPAYDKFCSIIRLSI